MNKIILSGRFTADAEIRQTPDNVSVLRFTLAVPAGKEKTDFIPCVAWRENAVNIAKYFGKGKPIEVEGRLTVYNYTHKDGSKRTGFEVNVSTWGFVLSDKTAEAGAEQSAPPILPPDTDLSQFEEISNENLPF